MRAAALLAVVLAAPQAWEPFTARRESSPRGRHYAVLRPSKDGGEVRIEFARRREGAAPLPAVRDLPVTAPPDAPRPDFARDPADALLGSGPLPWPPLLVRVLDDEPAVVVFERYAAPGSGDALALVGADGKPRWRRALAELFPVEATAALPREGGNVWWWHAFWVDEARGRIVLVAAGDLFREVALADGAVSEAGPAVLLTRVLDGPEEERAAALEVAARVLPGGIEAPARKVADDGSAPPALRVRAALVLHRKTPGYPAGPFFRDALARGRPPESRAFAARWIGEVLGKEAIPLLRDALRGEADDAWRPALEALAGLGADAVPALTAMLGEKDQHLDYRGGAAHALGAMKAEAALPALWKAA
ncbi:MAG TPA: HEAT repeat domain-containing protein, partial [Planctomycetota bacterium]|nr:HEAT repeat domain-containing protein [Planctomycetota bacterium]